MKKAKTRASITISLVIISIFSAFGSSVFAQDESEFSQQLFQIYQASSNKIDNLINFIAMITTIFGIIVAIVVGFFAIRQLSVDREIKEYKEEIKRQKELIKREAIVTKKELTNLRVWAKEKKGEIQKILAKPTSKKTRQQLKKLEEEIDKLREEIAYRRGSISVLPKSIDLSTLGSISALGAMETTKICNRCGQTYFDDAATRATAYSQCPYCGNLNY